MLQASESTENLGILATLGIYVLGLALFFLEIFLPSGGLIFVGAVLCVGFGIWNLFEIEPAVAWVCLVLTALYLVFLVRWGIRRLSFAGNLGTETSSGEDVKRAVTMVGREAICLTDLRPSGVVELDDERYDVISSGGFFTSGDRVRVVNVSGNRIVVSGVEDSAPDPTPSSG